MSGRDQSVGAKLILGGGRCYGKSALNEANKIIAELRQQCAELEKQVKAYRSALEEVAHNQYEDPRMTALQALEE